MFCNSAFSQTLFKRWGGTDNSWSGYNLQDKVSNSVTFYYRLWQVSCKGILANKISSSEFLLILMDELITLILLKHLYAEYVRNFTTEVYSLLIAGNPSLFLECSTHQVTLSNPEDGQRNLCWVSSAVRICVGGNLILPNTAWNFLWKIHARSRESCWFLKGNVHMTCLIGGVRVVQIEKAIKTEKREVTFSQNQLRDCLRLNHSSMVWTTALLTEQRVNFGFLLDRLLRAK